MTFSRLRLLAVALLAMCVLAGCAGTDESAQDERGGQLPVSPSPGRENCPPGVHRLSTGDGQTALMHVSAEGTGGKKALLLVLHGAGGSASDGLNVFRGSWDTPGLVLVAPAAESSTWSVVSGRDTDRPAVTHALGQVLRRCPIDSRRMGVAGFSDGASYALSLGLANGQLIRAVIALSPGGVAIERSVGRPRVFIAHGTDDSVLPISETSDVIVPRLREEGYRVTYLKFPGGHEVPEAISRRAVRWFQRG